MLFFTLSMLFYVFSAFFLFASVHKASAYAPQGMAFKPRNAYHILALSSLCIAFFAHALFVLPQVYQHGLLFLNLPNSLNVIALVFTLFSLGLSSYRPRVMVLSLMPVLCAVSALSVYILVPRPAHYIATVPHPLLMTHIILSLLAYCLLFMATAHAVMYALQNKHLKRHEPTKRWMQTLPPLLVMEKLLFDMLLLGFVLLSAALVAGFMGVNNLLAQHLAHKTFFSVLSWLTFAVLLVGRFYYGWRGSKAVHYVLIGFTLLLTGFIGSKLVLEMILKQ